MYFVDAYGRPMVQPEPAQAPQAATTSHSDVPLISVGDDLMNSIINPQSIQKLFNSELGNLLQSNLLMNLLGNPAVGTELHQNLIQTLKGSTSLIEASYKSRLQKLQTESQLSQALVEKLTEDMKRSVGADKPQHPKKKHKGFPKAPANTEQPLTE